MEQAFAPGRRTRAAVKRYRRIRSSIEFAIIFGGFNFNGFSTYSDVWVLSNANGLGGPPVWTQLQPIGGPPSGITEGAAIYDPVNNRMTAFGGADSSFFNFTNAVWVLTNANGQGGTPEWI